MKDSVIFIYAPGYNISSGGNSILHYLCDNINNYSKFKSYIIPFNNETKTSMGSNLLAKEKFQTNDSLNIKIYDNEFDINYETDFIIYPESIYGNPLNFKNVIRWILYFPEKTIYESFKPDDIVLFYCHPYLRNLYQFSDINFYHPDIIDYYNDDLNTRSITFTILNKDVENKINNMNNKRPNDTLYTRRKIGGIYKTPQHTPKDIQMMLKEKNLIENQELTPDNMNNLFNSHKNFMSYDLYTYLTRLSLKAGCKTYVYPNSNLHKEDWKYKCPWMNGIKYGKDDNEPNTFEDFDFNEFNKQNVLNLDDIILKRMKFNNIRFTEPLINLFNQNGIEYNIINTNINLNEFSIELQFMINNFDFDYINLFDLNYGGLNKGPRCELNKQGVIGLVIGEDINKFDSYVFDINIKKDVKYFLKINFTKDNITYNINNIIKTLPCTTKRELYSINNIAIAGGFNDSRQFKETLYMFKLYNYNISTDYELNHYLPEYDVFMLNYPRKIFNCFTKYDKLNVNLKYTFTDITLKFSTKLLDITNKTILSMNNINIQILNKMIYISLNSNNYKLCNARVNKIFDFIISIDSNNKKMIVSVNEVVSEILLNEPITINATNLVVSQFLPNLSISNFQINNYLNFDNIDLSKLINYYNTFGFLKISNLFINMNENMIKAYSYNTSKYSISISNYIPRAMEYLNFFTNIILNEKIHRVFKKLFNSEYNYTGSDSKIYGSDTNWHCDRKTNRHYVKCGFYLDKLDENNGCLRVFPGSQHYNESFNNILSKKNIPLFLGPGGFDKEFIMDDDKDLPYFPVRVNYGDFIVFNLGLYHSAFNNHNNKKMICMNFCELYNDINDPEKVECINSDFNIIARNINNLDISRKLTIYDNNFLDYMQYNQERYKLIQSIVECENSLDKFVRSVLNKEDSAEINEFCNNNQNTNIKKSNKITKVYNYNI